MLPPSVQVCPVEIPGRGRREGEPSINEISELANILAHSLPLQVTFDSLCITAVIEDCCRNMLACFLTAYHCICQVHTMREDLKHISKIYYWMRRTSRTRYLAPALGQ